MDGACRVRCSRELNAASRLRGVGGFAGAAHVQNHAREAEIVGGVENAFQLIHGFDAACAFDFTDGEGSAAFAIDAEVATGRGVEGSKLQALIGESLGDGADFLASGVIEVAAGGEDFDGLKAGRGDLLEEFGG